MLSLFSQKETKRIMQPSTVQSLSVTACLILACWGHVSNARKYSGHQNVDDMLCYMFKSAIAPTWLFQPLHGQLYTKASKLQLVDLRVIIPVYQRTFDFDLLMNQWDRALRNTNLSVQVKIVEKGPTRLISDAMIRWSWLEYVFVPYFTSGGIFPKGFLDNVGFAQGARSKWVVFHDYEIAVPDTYIHQLESMIANNHRLKWAQPYYGKRVCYLEKHVSENYRNLCSSNKDCPDPARVPHTDYETATLVTTPTTPTHPAPVTNTWVPPHPGCSLSCARVVLTSQLEKCRPRPTTHPQLYTPAGHHTIRFCRSRGLLHNKPLGWRGGGRFLTVKQQWWLECKGLLKSVRVICMAAIKTTSSLSFKLTPFPPNVQFDIAAPSQHALPPIETE